MKKLISQLACVFAFSLFIQSKSYALNCYLGDMGGAVVATTTLPSDLYVLASTPDAYVIWQSPVITETIWCSSAVREGVNFWVNPAKTVLASGVEVGIVYNGKTYTQSSGRIPTGFSTTVWDNRPMAYTATFNISYSIVLLRKGSAPQTGKADIANYAIFQMDGDGGANENPYRNFRRLINGSVKFTRGTCSLRVGDETKTVKLSPIVLSKLPPVGGTVGRVPFSLQVRQCDEGVKGAAFTFTGTADSSNANALANTGTARGVALYLRSADDNGVVPPSGTDRKRMASIVGSEGTLDLNAEYVVTSPNVAPGTVNSRVTFGISYQ